MQKRINRIGWIYGITAIFFFLIDLIWIGFLANDFYAENIGGMLRDSVNWPAARVFYMIYIGGIVSFVLVPLTALAPLKGWPIIVTIVDMAWGTFLTESAASGSLLVIKNLLKPGGCRDRAKKRSYTDG